jgi:hypothetical protein
MRRIAVLLLALALGVSACGGDGGGHDKPAAQQTVQGTPLSAATVTGRLLAVGGPAGTPNRPLRGTVILHGPGGSIVKAPVGRDGKFQIQIAAGRYRIEGKSPDYLSGTGICRTDARTTTLILGKTVTADVLCQEF